MDDRNAQGEIYLTDIVELAVREGLAWRPSPLEDAEEALGVNTARELAEAATARVRNARS